MKHHIEKIDEHPAALLIRFMMMNVYMGVVTRAQDPIIYGPHMHGVVGGTDNEVIAKMSKTFHLEYHRLCRFLLVDEFDEP
jgi:hypothetical protein